MTKLNEQAAKVAKMASDYEEGMNAIYHLRYNTNTPDVLIAKMEDEQSKQFAKLSKESEKLMSHNKHGNFIASHLSDKDDEYTLTYRLDYMIDQPALRMVFHISTATWSAYITNQE